MKKISTIRSLSGFVLILLLTLPSLIIAQQTIYGSIMHDNMQREYILYVPASYNGSADVPLIFNFHGYTSSAQDQMAYGDFRPIADTANFLLVHPMGTLDNSGNPHFNVGWGGSTVDDIGFTSALIDSLLLNYNIDTSRIYSTGMSNGGFMSYQLACQLGDRIAAIASVTGSMSPSVYNNCNTQRPTPILEIHGTADFIVPYNGSPITKSISDVLQYWSGYNNCTTTPNITMLPNTNTNDGSTVEHFEYSGCNNSITVEHFKVIGGGHTWPGSAVPLPMTNRDINASVEIWKFFSRYDINGLITQSTGINNFNDPIDSKLIYPNPISEYTVLQFELSKRQKIQLQLFDLNGILVHEFSVNSPFNSGTHEVTLQFPVELSSGEYLLKLSTDEGAESIKILKH